MHYVNGPTEDRVSQHNRAGHGSRTHRPAEILQTGPVCGKHPPTAAYLQWYQDVVPPPDAHPRDTEQLAGPDHARRWVCGYDR